MAVVASEIGKLAESSSLAAKEITESIGNMDHITHQATREFEQMLMKTKGNLTIAHHANDSMTDSPARAASIVAFKANNFVCSAIP